MTASKRLDWTISVNRNELFEQSIIGWSEEIRPEIWDACSCWFLNCELI